MATTIVIVATLPRPQLAVSLPQHRGGFDDRQICGHRLKNFCRQRRIVKASAETFRFLPQFIVMVAPIKTDAVNVRKTLGVPGPVTLWLASRSAGTRRILADAQISLPGIPRQAQDDGFRLARSKSERHR